MRIKKYKLLSETRQDKVHRRRLGRSTNRENMAFGLLYVLLMINTFELARENPIYSYRFKVYPVDRCPMNATEFEAAARRRNCTEDSRYLCAPDKFLSNLIEFCTDRKIALYQEGNCLLLEGSGDLNHYNCVERFNHGCSLAPFFDNEIFKYPACLTINRDIKCFVAEKGCLKRIPILTEEGLKTSVIIPIVTIVLMVLVGVITGLIICKRRKKKKANGQTEMFSESKKEMQVDEKKLKDFLNNGELTVSHVRCIIVGCAGAGKTTLLKRLENVPYEKLKNIKSTKGVDVHVNSFELLQDEETIQSVERKNKLPSIIFSTNMVERNTITEITETNVKSEEESGNDDEAEYISKVEIENKDKMPKELGTVSEGKHTEERDHSDDESNDDHGLEVKVEKYSTSPAFSTFMKRTGTKEPNQSSRKKINFSERYESKNIDLDENTSEKNKFLPYPEGEKMLLKRTVENRKESECRENYEDKRQINLDSRRERKCEDIESHQDLNDNEQYAMSKILDVVKQLSDETHLRPRITFLDFAGQSLYYAVHQFYLSPKTCYILVMDMTKCPDEQEREKDGKAGGHFESYTYKDYYKFWLKSIDSYSDINTPVILVGTHAEEKSKEECCKFFQDFFKLFKNDDNLRRHLHRDRKFAIGFPRSSGSELEDLIQIKKCIAQIVQDPDFTEKQIRPVWAVFEHILLREKAKRIISREELLAINERNKVFRMKDDEITEMLLFLHRVGSLLYFHEDDLQETIILDIEWFVNAFKCIIVYPVDIKYSDSKREQFHRTGEISDEELTYIWEKEECEYLTYKTKIILLMEQLGLLTLFSTEENVVWYYIPSMNKRRFPSTARNYTKSSILCFQFDKNGQLPIYPFYGVVLKCMKLPQWSLLRENDENCIYENVVCFLFEGHIVVICLCKFQIQVQVQLPKKGVIKTEFLKNILEPVEKIIEKYKRYSFQIGYKCQNGVLNDESDITFIAKEQFNGSTEELMCWKCDVNKKHYVDINICWTKTEEHGIVESQRRSKANEEIDEGLVSRNHILKACLDGNTEDFFFHLRKEISPRSHLLMRPVSEGWNVLHVAAKGGNKIIFRSLLSENCNICKKTRDEMTVLHIASKYGHFDICEYILNDCKADFKNFVGDISSEGKNACHYAAESGSVDTLRLLAQNGIDAKAVTNTKENIFHIACVFNKLEMCKYISEEFKDLLSSECEDRWDATLHAAKNGNTNILEFLKKVNGSLEHQSVSGRNALHIACDNGHLDACKYITGTCSSLLSVSDHKGRYAVHFAARSGNMDLLKYLETKTALTVETHTGMNVLHMACLHDHIEMCKYILERCPGLNVKVTKKGWTTAHFVAGRGNKAGNEIKIFEMLLNAEKPVEILHLSNRGNSVLTLAIKYNVYEFAKYLFENHNYLLQIQGANNPRHTGNENPKMLELLYKYLDKLR